MNLIPQSSAVANIVLYYNAFSAFYPLSGRLGCAPCAGTHPCAIPGPALGLGWLGKTYLGEGDQCAALGHVLYTWGTEAIAEWLGLWRPSGPVSLPKQGHLEQVTQHHAHGLLWAFSFNHQYCATTKRSVVEQSHQKFTHNSCWRLLWLRVLGSIALPGRKRKALVDFCKPPC